MKKNILLTLIALMCAMYAQADYYNVNIGDLYYNIYSTGNTATVTYSSSKYSGDIVIPEIVIYRGKTYSVTSIGDNAFYGCTGLTSVTISNGVTSIGSYAFSGCDGLTSVTIPNSVTSIGGHAFYGCTGLTSITIPNSVTSIGSFAFYHCTGLTSITIPNSVTSIGERAFSYVPNIIYYGTATGAPWGAKSMNGYIDGYLVYEDETKNKLLACSSATTGEIVIPKSVMSIGEYAFSGCTGLTSITIPNSVTSIGDYAFFGCTGLTSVTIPNSVTSIGWSAFKGCTSLTSVTIGNGVTSIGGAAFYDCTGLMQTNYTGDIAGWCAISFAGYANPIYYSHNLYINGAKITDLIIPDKVTSIGDRAFEDCTGLTSVIIPSSVTSIGLYAFNGCSGLTSIVVESGNTIYDSRDNCNAIIETATNTLIQGCNTTIIPNSVTSIGDEAFCDCTGLTSVIIPSSVTSIGGYAFYDCIGLTSVTIGNSVTSIGWSAFDGCTGLTSVTIGNSVTGIGRNAFDGCTGLTSVTIPNRVTSIGDEAFDDVPNIVYNGIATGSPWGARNVNCYADGYLVYEDASKTILLACSSAATDITIPNSVTSIGWSAFNGCTGLTNVTIPNSVTSIGGAAFSGCTGLTSVTIGNSVTSIDRVAFSRCTGLTNITWNVKAYQDIAYQNTPFVYFGWTGSRYDIIWDIRKQITSFVFGEDVESIPAYLCDGMTNIEYIRTEATTPPVVGYHSLNNVPRDIPVYVPCGTKTAYQNADGWNEFHNFIEPAPEFNYTIALQSANQEQGNVTITNEVKCENRVTIEATANTHYHFTQWSDGNTDNPRTLILTQDTTCIAEFDANEYTVNALPNIAEYGNVSGSGTYKYQSEVLLIATSNTYYRFTKWSDGKTLNRRKIVVTQDTTFTAEFAPKQYSITATGEHGRIEGSGRYDYNTQVCLTAVPDKGYHFVKWNNGETSNPLCFNAHISIRYTAEFAPNQYTITTYAQHGNVSGGGTYDYGTTTTLTAIANEHYHFTQWSDGNTDNPRIVSIEGDATYTAEFKPDSYTIIVSAGEHGSVNGGGTYDYGTTATLTATADEHYHFTQWSDGNTDNPRTVSVVGDVTYTAEFAIDQHTITTNAHNGTITGGGIYDYGTTATLTATADEHYHFTQWSDGNTDNPRTVAVVGDATYTAEFAINRHSITVIYDTQQGVVTGAGTYAYGTQVTLTAIASKGYEFAQWSNGVTDNPYLLTATEDLSLEAQFIPATAVENVSADGDTAARKVFRDGQVYILRNGKTYTTTGVEVK